MDLNGENIPKLGGTSIKASACEDTWSKTSHDNLRVGAEFITS